MKVCYKTCYMLCNMIHNVLQNMLRAKNPPSHFPLPGPGSTSPQCKFIQQLLVGLALLIREGHATFLAGLISCRGGAVGGARRGALASTIAAAPSFLGGYLVFQASIFRATYFLQCLVDFASTSSSFSMAPASLYKQSSLASNMGS